MRDIVVCNIDGYLGTCSPGDEKWYVPRIMLRLGIRACAVTFKHFQPKRTPDEFGYYLHKKWSVKYEL